MRAEKPFPHRVQRRLRQPLPDADARHHAETLGLDENLPLLAFVAAHLAAQRVVGAQEPISVPAVPEHRLGHARLFGKRKLRLVRETRAAAQGGIVVCHRHVHRGDEHRFRDAAVVVLAGLEALAGGL